LSREAIEVCKEIGNYNLFLIGDFEETLSMTQKEYKGEQLILFLYLLFVLSNKFLSKDTQLYFLNLVHQLEKQLENKAYNAPQYLFRVMTYGDALLGGLGVCLGQERLLDEKITFLKKSVMFDNCCSLRDRTFPIMSEMCSTLSPQRLFNCYTFQMIMDDKKINKVQVFLTHGVTHLIFHLSNMVSNIGKPLVSGELVIATGHAMPMLINMHLFE
jgi:hypothetical protein